VLALVDNALSHAPSGSTVTVSTRVDGGAAVLSVTDRGAGITGIDPARVFDRFARADPPPAAPAAPATVVAPAAGPGRRPSFGIGLALVREIALRHGGSVRVAATAATGTTLELALPVAATSD